MSKFASAKLGATGGMTGPFLNWIVAPDDTWNIPGRCFTIRGHDLQDTKRAERASTKFMIDIENIRVGWQDFVAPKQSAHVWAPAGEFDPSPYRPAWSGPRYPDDKGPQTAFAMSVLVATADGKKMRALWAQSQRSSIIALQKLLETLAQTPEADDGSGRLPIVALTEPEVIKSRSGSNMVVPTLEITEWRERPDDLPNEDPVGDGGAASVGAQQAVNYDPPLSQRATSSGPRQAPPSSAALAAAHAAQAPVNDLDDEIPF